MKKEDAKAVSEQTATAITSPKPKPAKVKKKAAAKPKPPVKKKAVIRETPAQENPETETVVEAHPQVLIEQPPVAEAVIFNLAGEFRELVGQLSPTYPDSEKPVLYEQAYGEDGFITRLKAYRNNPGLPENRKGDYDFVVAQVKKAVDDRLAGYKPSAKEKEEAVKKLKQVAAVPPQHKPVNTNPGIPVLPQAPGTHTPPVFIPPTPEEKLENTFNMVVAYIKKARAESILLHEYALKDMLKVESVGGLNFSFDPVTKKLTATLGQLTKEEVLTCF